MKKTTIIMAIAIVLLLTCCSYEPVFPYGEPRYESIVVIGIDGGGGLFNDGDALTDEFRAFFSTEDSSIGFRYQCENPSISAQNWGSYLHGVSPSYHGKNNGSAASSRYTNKAYPSVFQIIHDVYPDAQLASICHWIPINYGLIETTAGVYKDPDRPGTDDEYSDEEVCDRVCSYIDANGTPDLLFVHFDSADGAGHGHGYGSPEHLQAIRNIQGYIMDIFSKYNPETTLFLITIDHGGTPSGSHGGTSDAEMNIAFAIRGHNVDPAAMEDFDLRPRDVAAIILTAMRIQIPKYMQGRCPIGLFKEDL